MNECTEKEGTRRPAAAVLPIAMMIACACPVLAVSAILAPAARAAAAPERQTGPGLAGPVLFDKTKPIEITSDRLDIDQETKTAVFQGQVDAIQGEVHLRADRLKVYYEGEAGPAAASTSPPDAPLAADGSPAAASGAAGGKIRRMDVDGKVFVSSPSETASGDNAVYEADTGKITLHGNVVLTRGLNVIRGTKLVMDVDTGRSVIESTSSVGGGRVKGLFAPKQDEADSEPATAGRKSP